MMVRKKIILLTCSVLVVGSIVGYTAFADNNPKFEKLANLKKDFEIEKEDLKKIKDPKESDQQGRILKQKSVEIGQLENEVSPPSTEQKLEDGIKTAGISLGISEKLEANHPNALKQLDQARIMLNEVETNWKNKAKTAEDLLKDIEKVNDLIKNTPNN